VNFIAMHLIIYGLMYSLNQHWSYQGLVNTPELNMALT